MNILLACAFGMSTGMLVEKMREAAKKEGKEYEIRAVDVSSVDKYISNYDVLLIGPQASYLLDDMKGKYEPEVPVDVIPVVDYGRMNGKNVLRMAEKMGTR